MNRAWLLSFLLFVAAAVAQKVNPHSQINWPASCNAPGMVYNIATNTCTDISHVPPANVAWPASCATGTYVPASNTCVATGTAANPGGSPNQLQYNAGGTFQGVAGASVDGSGNITTLAAGTVLPAIRPVADVTSPVYGALGNGIANDGPAIRAAKNAIVAAGGGTVYFPKGTYNLTTTDSVGSGAAYIFAQSNNLHFECAPGVVFNTLAPGSSNASVFYLGYPQNNTYIQNYTIAGTAPTKAYQANTIALAGSTTITLTTPADTSHFAVGDPIYILGGPGREANGDGEINWVTAIDGVGGVLTLRLPTSKPYTGNVSQGMHDQGLVMVMDGAGAFWNDVSIKGCTANPGADFAFFGQIIGGQISNNTVTIAPTATRGMFMNSFGPMASIEMAGNTYTQGQTSAMAQLADGMRDFYIHDNTFSSPYGVAILNPSQGIVSLNISHNSMYMTNPAGVSIINQAAIVFSTAYNAVIAGNTIMVGNANAASAVPAIQTGLSNGACTNCMIANNQIIVNGGTGSAVNIPSSFTVLTGNNITTNNHIGLLLAGSNIMATGNTIHYTSPGVTPLYAVGITGTDDTFVSNYVYSDVNTIPAVAVTAIAGSENISNNFFSGTSAGVALASGGFVALNNICDNVVTATGCNSIGDLGAQKFVGAIAMAVLATPVVATPVAKTTGGTLAASTQFCYQVQARNAIGYSAASAEKCVTTAGTTSTNSVSVYWNSVPGATTYAIYGRTTGTETHMAPDLNLSLTTFIDTGSITPSGAIQATMPNAPIDQAGYVGMNSSGTAFELKLQAPAAMAANVTLTITKVSPASITPAAATASSCVEQTFATYTGLAAGQSVSVSPPASLGAHIWIGSTRVSAANTLAVSFCADATGGTPPAGVYLAMAF